MWELVDVSRCDEVLEVAKRRGFFWPSSEIYGGVAGFIDFGPLGSLLKRNIERKWREWFVVKHQEFIAEVETPIIMPSKVFEASGHVAHFTDIMVECLKCRRKFRADHIIEEQAGFRGLEGLKPVDVDRIVEEGGFKCPECGGGLSEAKFFNLLFQTTIGPYSDYVGYARPEAAQGMFTSFSRVYTVMRGRLPLGIAQIGKVLRNEISPRQGPIRLREFTIMELELFFDPEEARCPLIDKVKNERIRLLPMMDVKLGVKEPRELTVQEALENKLILMEWNAYFMALALKFVESLGIPAYKQMFKEKLPAERAHYALQVYDQEVYLDRWGWVELSGHAYRTDYDLKRHGDFSRQDLSIFKSFEKPAMVEKLSLKPNDDLIKSDFKDEAPKIIKLLLKANPEEVDKSFKKSGFYNLEGYIIKPAHVALTREEATLLGCRFIPHVAEPSFGAERLVYATLEYSYSEKEGRVILKIPRDIAPVKAVILPLVNKDGLPEAALKIYEPLKDEGLIVEYDDAGSIGRRYARADEAGVPIAITIDYDTLKDNTVTLRDRDSWQQVRCKAADLPMLLSKYIKGALNFEELGVRFMKAT